MKEFKMEPQSVWYYLSWFVTFLIGFTTYVTVKHYLQVRTLPPGPFSFPIIGSILAFRKGIGQHILMEMAKKYKGMFTCWIGSSPVVVVLDWKLCKEALVTKRDDFSGRVTTRPSTKMMTERGKDVITSDLGPCWEILKKVLVSSTRKFAVSEKLCHVVSDVVETSVERMLKEGKPVDGLNYSYLIIYNIIASSAFGQRYEMEDPEFVALRTTNEELFEAFQSLLPAELMPILAIIYRKRMREVKGLMRKFHGTIGSKYCEHLKTYQKGIVRDFTDTLILAKEEAEKEGKDSLEHLTDGNLEMVLVDFFSGGTETTRTNLLWILLLISNEPEFQTRMQAEIDEVIGSRQPSHEDKKFCSYIEAVITESLRYRPVVETTLEHKTVCDTELGGHKVPKETPCLFHILNSHRDETLWESPNEFKPERFLDENGKFIKTRFDGYMPFGLGRRSCAGEKLAIADIFLILTNLLQRVTVELENGPGSGNLTPKPRHFACMPETFNIVVKKRSQP